MKKISLFGLFIVFTSVFCRAQTYKFINAQWFDGEKFVSDTWYSTNGFLTKHPPVSVDSVVDLMNGFVLPAFGEAHNHNVSAHSIENFPALSNAYLKAGIYYVQNPNSLLEDRTQLLGKNLINNATSIDAVFANGGLTCKDGHPTRFFGAATPQGEGNFYHSINSLEDLESKWPRILAGKPDFIKAYLLFSDEYEARESTPRFSGLRGLSQSVLAEVVKKAHGAGLRVGVHVETGEDFHAAVSAGADEILHMPGFRGDPGSGLKVPEDFMTRFAIRKGDATLAAKNKTVVVTTLGDTRSMPFFFGLRRKAHKLQKQNLKMLKDERVSIALGSDSYEKNSLIEIKYISGLKVFTNAELIALLCETTPQAIFPSRKIGKIAEDYEANFVVMTNDPIKNIRSIEKIAHWVKAGKILDKQLRK